VTEETISFEFRASRRLLPLLIAAHAGTALILMLTLPWPWLPGCACLLLASNAIWLILRRDRVDTVSRFELAADGDCLCLKAGHIEAGRLRTDTAALPWLIVLRFDLDDRRGVRSLILFPGAMRGDDWRRLQVFLRWGVRFTAAAPIPSAGHF
jgi:toxin CptA